MQRCGGNIKVQLEFGVVLLLIADLIVTWIYQGLNILPVLCLKQLLYKRARCWLW